MARQYKQGKYVLRNPEKYIGDKNGIVYRSSWELRVLKWLDENPKVKKFSSEEIIIPYYSPVDKKMHRYFPDFYVEVESRSGDIKKYLVEVKPLIQTKEPEKKKRVTKGYVQNYLTFQVNSAKWNAATTFCQTHGWTFMLLTEKDIGVR